MGRFMQGLEPQVRLVFALSRGRDQRKSIELVAEYGIKKKR